MGGRTVDATSTVQREMGLIAFPIPPSRRMSNDDWVTPRSRVGSERSDHGFGEAESKFLPGEALHGLVRAGRAGASTAEHVSGFDSIAFPLCLSLAPSFLLCPSASTTTHHPISTTCLKRAIPFISPGFYHALCSVRSSPRLAGPPTSSTTRTWAGAQGTGPTVRRDDVVPIAFFPTPPSRIMSIVD
ncbi:hypothetical protein B0H17DRAFT_1094289 [Mycena rosella]|uniref:Uncharacterized protein n=1 Tax=Mycena rosella TaxID=1033263 RepID=A0AAD7CSV1_MYCRO|nr:hypothetical protein B0H17DRAFT_1094289 [Mycena rosella]